MFALPDLRVMLCPLILMLLVGWPTNADSPPAPEQPNIAVDVGIAIDAGIADQIDQLSSRRFATRQRAMERLIAQGVHVIAPLEASAVDNDLDRVHRCITILSEIAQDKDSREAAIQALERLSVNESCPASALAKERAFALRETPPERAERLLLEQGVRVRRSSSTKVVYSVSGIYRDRQCVHLRQFPGLTSVSLSGAGVTNRCMPHLQELPQLQSLSLMRTSLTDAGLSQLDKLPKIGRISLYADSVSASGLEHLAKLPNLTSLSLYAPIEADALRVLSKLPLRMLSLGKVVMSDEVVGLLPQLSCRSRLSISIHHATDDDLQALSKINTSYLSLSIEESPQISDEGMQHLRASKLTSLRIRGTAVTDVGLTEIATFRTLGYLSLYDVSVTDRGLQRLAALPKLRAISLRNTHVTDEGLDSLKKSLPNLKYARNHSPIPPPKGIGPAGILAKQVPPTKKAEQPAPPVK